MVKNTNDREVNKTQEVSKKVLEPVLIDTDSLNPVVKEAVLEISRIRATMKTGKKNIRSLLKVLPIGLTESQIAGIKSGAEIVFSKSESTSENTD